MKDPLSVNPSKGNQGTARGKEKILLTSVGIEPTTSGLDLPWRSGVGVLVVVGVIRELMPDLVKIENWSHKRSHKLDGIGDGTIRTFPFLLIPFTTPSVMIQWKPGCRSRILLTSALFKATSKLFGSDDKSWLDFFSSFLKTFFIPPEAKLDKSLTCTCVQWCDLPVPITILCCA